MNPSRKRVLVAIAGLFVPSVLASCNVCRGGGQVIDKGKNFKMTDSSTGQSFDWNCGYLEMSVADVDPINGAQGESFMCALAQLWVELECPCDGPAPPPRDDVKDANPACDLCGGIDGKTRDLDFIPEVLKEELVDTGVAGRMACGGLYHALSEGVLTANLCPTVKRNAGEFCCSFPVLDDGVLASIPAAEPGPAPGPAPTPASVCKRVFEDCSAINPCCRGYDCKIRVLGDPPICSTRATRPRESMARQGAGGAGGATKFAN
jgi:predicted small secreted protein